MRYLTTLLFSLVTCLPVLIGFAGASYADDLPDEVTVARRSYPVEVFEIISAKVVRQTFDEKKHETDLSRIRGIIEIVAEVQGNVCLADPETLAVEFNRIPGKNEVIVSLTVSGNYRPDPWAIDAACTMHAKNTQVTIPLSISLYESEYSRRPTWKFMFDTTRTGSRDVETQHIEVQVVDAADGKKKLQVK
ncbi:MAG: hypothetical protein RIQ81_1252 [Pseudomonadota bacterium]|jgi:hypothetical protein